MSKELLNSHQNDLTDYLSGSLLTYLGTFITKYIIDGLPSRIEIVHTIVLSILTLFIGFFGTMLLKFLTKKIKPKL